MNNEIYSNPLCERYSSKEMMYNFSPDKKFSTWRKLWIALAESEKELGLDISQEQIDEMKKNIHNIDYELAAKKEKEFRHDVMAHVHTFGTQAPLAMPIIHLGATSAFVGDNTDLIQIKDGLEIIKADNSFIYTYIIDDKVCGYLMVLDSIDVYEILAIATIEEY